MLNKILISLLFLNSVYCLNGTVLNLKEGSKCPYNENITGTCVNFFKCTRLILDMPQKNYPPLCSFDGTVPIVCCTSCDLVANIDDAVRVSSGLIYWKSGHKSQDHCLDYARYAVKKCIANHYYLLKWNESEKCYDFNYSRSPALTDGGRNAYIGEMPHMALLGYGDELKSLQWICGGSLISENFILTAAHCARSDLLGPVTYAALGFLNRDDPPATRQRYRVKTIIVHPEYRPPVKYHDIALLETEKRVRLSSLVIPGCLPNLNLEDYVNDRAPFKYYGQVADSTLSITAAGWGALGFRKALANTLQVINVRSFAEAECLEHYPPHASIPHGYNKTTQLCFGDKEKSVDTCEGDSGGPLQALNSYCTYTILGVTSFGRACGFVGNAGIYTRVVHYVAWIESIIWKEN